MSNTNKINLRAQMVIAEASAKGLKIATAESCTGGMIAAALTDSPGSSAAFDRGFIVYSNEAKTQMLNVPLAIIVAHGAVSQAVAAKLAREAINHSEASLAISVTGVAGPAGGSPDKPVGTVWFGLAGPKNDLFTEKCVFAGGSRDYVRLRTVETALGFLLYGLSRS